MKTAIVGYGIVGRATHLGLLADDPAVTIKDINIDAYRDTLVQAHELIFVCVPTGNHADMQALLNLCQNLIDQNPKAELVIRSTIPPAYVESVRQVCGSDLVYCPEFLRERKWQQDCQERPVLLASEKPHILVTARLPADHFRVLDLQQLVMIKIMSNVMNAMRVTFANHVYDLCQSYGVDYAGVAPYLDAQQKRPDQSYLMVDQNLRGFGGKCLPKDLQFCIDEFDQRGIVQDLFSAIQTDNSRWPETVRQDL